MEENLEEKEIEHVRMMKRGKIEFQPPHHEPPHKMLNVCCTSNRYGYVALGTATGVDFCLIRSLEIEYEHDRDERALEMDSNRGTTTSSIPIPTLKPFASLGLSSAPYLIALGSQDQLVAIAYGNVLELYDVSAVMNNHPPPHENKFQPIQTIQLVDSSPALVECSWSKMKTACHLLTLNEQGQVTVYDAQLSQVSMLPCSDSDTKITAACWAPEEPQQEQIVLGYSNGRIRVVSSQDPFEELQVISIPSSVEESEEEYQGR